ncbi:MAG: DUF177 domain-containing protein [Muribaculaceae bacterium]
MGKFSEFKLPLKSMPIGSQEFDYHLDKQFFINMESSDVHGADLNVRLTVENRGEMYDLTFVITGEVTLICDRCLDNMQHEIDTTYHITVKYGADYNDDTDDLLEIPESDNYLNVSYLIYDTVELAIPLKHVHAPGKCNRAMSGKLNKHRARIADDEDSEMEEEILDEIDSAEETPTDPRWSALEGLKGDDGDNN